MTGSRAWMCVLALVVALLAPSCNPFRRQAKTKVPLPPPPQPTTQTTKPAPPQTPSAGTTVPSPPEIQPQPPNISQPPVEPSKLPPPPRRKTTRSASTPSAAPESTPAPQQTPTPPLPQLEQVLTAEQQKAYNDEIDSHISSTQRVLASLSGRRLNNEQRTYFDRIQAFVKQAEEARKTDLFRARNLAERASLLANDLVRSLQ